MNEGDEPTAAIGERSALLREIEACDVRLRFLTVTGYDDDRVGLFRRELIERREKAPDGRNNGLMCSAKLTD